MDNISSLYHTSLDGIKQSGQNQYIALCPFHEDKKQSFSFNSIGLANCFACGWKGNAYQYAKERGFENPNQYIVDMNGSASYTPKPKYVEKDTSPNLNLDALMKQYKDNFKAKWNELDYRGAWKKEIIDELDIGYCDGKLMFAHHDINGNIITIRTHKNAPVGDKQCKWYLRHKLALYDKDKDLYICEGEKDAGTPYSQGLQTTCGTTGAIAIPKDEDGNYDFEPFKDWKGNIFICYDNDGAGKEGAESLGQKMIAVYPNLNIHISQWDEELPDKYDVYDAFSDKTRSTGYNFWMSVANAEEVKFKYPKRIGTLKMTNGEDADSRVVEDVVQIIENLVPEGCQIVLGGTTGANKSYMAMQLGMSLAIDSNEFLGFKINKKGLKVLYIDTECGDDEMTRRYQRIQQHFEWTKDASSRFNWACADGEVGDIYKDMEQAVKFYKPDILIIDCLYNTTTDGADISKNHNLKPYLNKITKMKYALSLTIIAVHHMNKGNHEKGLDKDRMSGGSNLGYWMEHCILLTRTNDTYTRLLRVDKSRVIDYSESYYAVEWNPHNHELKNVGILEDWKPMLLTEHKANKFAELLDSLPNEFSYNDIRNKIENNYGVTDRTSRNWVAELVKIKSIERISQGHYKKRIKIITNEE